VLSIEISKKTHDEAQKELIQKMSAQVDFFGSQQGRNVMADVFKACPVRPVVVSSVEAKCTGEVLEGVLVMCKILSYEKGVTGARFVVDLSGLRVAIDAFSIRLSDLRCVGVEVGHLSPEEALFYATERMPFSLGDQNRRDAVAKSVVDTFDGRVLTLQRVCEALRKGLPGDVGFVEAAIERERETEEKEALSGWVTFSRSLSKHLDTEFDATALEEAARLLQKGSQDAKAIVSLLSPNKTTLAPRNRRLFNADAGYHPLSIDPFGSTLSLSGKAITERSKRLATTPQSHFRLEDLKSRSLSIIAPSKIDSFLITPVPSLGLWSGPSLQLHFVSLGPGT
jgi:hypothetical protein